MVGKQPFTQMMTPKEVADAFLVDPKTVTRWARSGRLPATRTPGGHHRFRRDDVDEFLRFGTPDDDPTEEEYRTGDARA